MPELTIKAMEGVGTLKGHCELTCAITLLLLIVAQLAACWQRWADRPQT